MLQNVYTLPDLIDLALTVPELGAVNFNILHAVLHTIVYELKMTDVRPWCHIENPLLAKMALTRAKLKDASGRRIISASTIEEKVGIIFPGHPSAVPTYDGENAKTQEDSDKLKPRVPSESSQKSPEKFIPAFTLQEEPAMEVAEQPEREEAEHSVILTEVPQHVEEDAKPALKSAAVPQRNERDRDTEQRKNLQEVDTTPKSRQRQQKTGDALKFINLTSRIEAMEEGMQTLSNSVDLLNHLISKAEKRKKEGGPASEELEAIDDRILEVEEALAQYAADHTLLVNMEGTLDKLQQEFEFIKAIAAQLEQMQLDIATKADKEETWAALATKGDLEIVNTKVDQLEFETAVEELGEATGLLGLKFSAKNDEWEDRASEIWRGIDSKMSRDIFEAAKVKIESRLTALMYGLKKLKKVVQDLLYPEAGGVTRCILCRRPACISGLECIRNWESPKRSQSDRRSEEEDSDKLKIRLVGDAFVKRQKLGNPPYRKSRETIITIPYNSSSYRREYTTTNGISQIPKLPNIDGSKYLRIAEQRLKIPVTRARNNLKMKDKKKDLQFTNKRLADLERNKDHDVLLDTHTFTDFLEVEPSEASRKSSRSSVVNINLTPSPEDAINDFTPARLMTDALRRDILISPTSSNETKSGSSHSTSQSDTDSRLIH